MTHELILTSVAHGLDPADHGFCPVAADSAISPRVLRHLFSLSQYRHLVAPFEGLSYQSPVAYSHLILPGELEHIVSRLADTGIDYRHRPNVLAHHIVVDAMEIQPEGPAWLSALPGFHFSQWKGSPIRFTSGRPIPTLTNPPSLTRRQQIARQFRWLDPSKMALTGSVDTQSTHYLSSVQNNDNQIMLTTLPTTPCPVWEELTGDAGWGGVLAETAFSEQPVVLICNPSQNILPLFVEALALLPLYHSWKVTFSTYFTGLPEAIPCQWKAVLAGSTEATYLAKDLNNLILNITLPLGESPSGKYVEYARLGQEGLLPVEAEEQISTLKNADTKPYSEDTSPILNKVDAKAAASTPLTSIQPPPIRLPQQQTGLSEFFLRRTSRFQFYFLYSIMFILVLVLLVLAVDQVGQFGFIERLRNGNLSADTILEDPLPPDKSEPELDVQIEPEIVEPVIIEEPENPIKIFDENRQKQREPMLEFWETFHLPDFLAVNLPSVQESLIDLPEKTTFSELKALFPFGSALELQFVPLFELPQMKIETRFDLVSLPELVWKVEAVDSQTQEKTPMFVFHLTESGFTMDWQPEGLNDQYLYDTILSSLGFLQLRVSDSPETTKTIPLFAPVYAVPMKVSDLAGLFNSERPEIAIDLPLASKLWQSIFAEQNPPRTLRLEVRAEPAENWAEINSVSPSEIFTEVRTSLQSGKPVESGETVFENIILPFTASASLEKVVWKGGGYDKKLREEKALILIENKELEQQIAQLKANIFDSGINEANRSARESCMAELQKNNSRLVAIESLLEKLPLSYDEMQQKESWYFHYSVYLESAEGKRKLLLLTTEQ